MEAQRSTTTTQAVPAPTRSIQFTVKQQPSVKWTEDTKDNEGLGRKKSKGNFDVLTFVQ